VAEGEAGTFSRGRVETFSDGVFAIIVTLLVLEIRVPAIGNPESTNELARSLAALLPKVLSWVTSFFTVCVIWVNHHRLFRMFRCIDHGLFWWNATLLLFVSFIPFPTALMGDYLANPVAVSCYGLVMGCMAMSFFLLRRHVIRNGALLREEIDAHVFAMGTKYALLFGPLPYLAGAAAGWMHPFISLAIYLAIPVYFIFPHSTQDV